MDATAKLGRMVALGAPAEEKVPFRMARISLPVIRSELFVVGAGTPARKAKLFQIIPRTDGLLIPFPYYNEPSAQLIIATIQAGKPPDHLEVSGPVATARVKYSHHRDGEAHFSQDGKIVTAVRKRSTPLADVNGHLFTVQLQGLEHFAALTGRDLKSTAKRAPVVFEFEREPTAVKIVGRLDSASDVARRLIRIEGTRPWFGAVRPGLPTLPGVWLSVGKLGTTSEYILTLTFEEVPPVSPGKTSILTFAAGFDSPDVVLDYSRKTTFLMLISPAGEDPSEAARVLGSVDLNRESGRPRGEV